MIQTNVMMGGLAVEQELVKSWIYSEGEDDHTC